MNARSLPTGSLRLIVAGFTTCLAVTTFFARANAQTTYASDYRYFDGATAHAEPVCATADLCGTIALRNGDLITVYAETTNGCAQPTLHVVHRQGTRQLLSYEMTPKDALEHRQASSGERAASYGCRGATAFVSFDRGRIRMAVVPLATGGQFFVRFAAGTTLERTNATPDYIKAP